MANFPWISLLRGIQALFAIIVLGLAGHIASIFDNGWDSAPDRVNLMVFNGVWTAFLVVPFFVVVPMFFPAVANKYVVLGVDTVTMIFWLAGFAALADGLPPSDICKRIKWCKEGQAATAFGAFEWVLFVATSVLSGLAAFRASKSSPQQEPPTTAVP